MAPQKEFESPTFRLGGGRSILLSYWGMTVLLYPNFLILSILSGGIFSVRRIYWQASNTERRMRMEEEKTPVDIDDWIFDEDDGQPSQR